MKSRGSENLRKWWEKLPYGSRFAVCADLRMPPQTLHRFSSGANPPDVVAAVRIEEYTKGAVRVHDWALPAEDTEADDKEGERAA
jgi:hypothetical protein